MIRILHISDFHLTGNGTSLWGVDVKRNFDMAIACIDKMKTDIDAIFITGDMSNVGSTDSYQYIDYAFRQIGVPTYCCPGNHDNLKNMATIFSNGYIKFIPVVYIADWKFIFLNSVIPDETEEGKNKARGWLSQKTLLQLEDALTVDNKNTCIVLHHPPIEPGGWLNRKLLDNRDEMIAIITKYPQAKLVLFGHTHYRQQLIQNNIIYSSAPAIGFAFDKDLPKFQIAHGNEGFNIVSIDDDYIKICTKTIYEN